MTCPFCVVKPDEILLTGERCPFIDTGDLVLTGSGMIVPRAHRLATVARRWLRNLNQAAFAVATARRYAADVAPSANQSDADQSSRWPVTSSERPSWKDRLLGLLLWQRDRRPPMWNQS